MDLIKLYLVILSFGVLNTHAGTATKPIKDRFNRDRGTHPA